MYFVNFFFVLLLDKALTPLDRKYCLNVNLRVGIGHKTIEMTASISSLRDLSKYLVDQL